MKEKYIPAELEIILFGLYDVITLSDPALPDDEDNNTGGNGIGGGYNPDGWT